MNIGELRFLVVEDHGFQRWVTGDMLRGLGAKHIFSAADGKAALELLRTLDPAIDVVVSDLDMPGMDGMEFIRHLGELGNPASLIVLSGLERPLLATVETMARAYRVNLLAAIEKPPTPNKLWDVLSSHAPLHTSRREESPKALTPFRLDQIAHGLRQREFTAFFQPKVDLRTRRVKGAEALARWRHPDMGLLPPQAFMGPLEQGGLLDKLTDVILEAAAFNCRLWHNGGLDMSVSVNLSLASLADPSLADRMLNIVQASGIEPRHVIFEVTESAAASDVGRTLESLSRLRMKGFGLAIGDSGTGSATMQRLSRVPFTELKIDQAFVKNASVHASSRAMLESSLEVARKLRLVAVAEGVENRVDWDLARDLDCPLAQGFLIAPPMEAGEFLDWVNVRKQVYA
jgi:EAL domain-containing protein (putative c-di-GMP-specific phosphodiesterase class I)/AmiR/NasT family two-component response regulator